MRGGEKKDFSMRFPDDGSTFCCQETRGERRREPEEERTEKRERDARARRKGEREKTERGETERAPLSHACVRMRERGE